MRVRELRLEKGWSQEQLATVSGLSVRTVQRIEQGGTAGLESQKCLAAAFETDIANLMREHTMAQTTNNNTVAGEPSIVAGQTNISKADEYVQNVKGLRLHFYTFLIVLAAMFALNLVITPNDFWITWIAAFWSLGLVLHAISVKVMYGSISLDEAERSQGNS